jgi:hypothetical protein
MSKMFHASEHRIHIIRLRDNTEFSTLKSPWQFLQTFMESKVEVSSPEGDAHLSLDGEGWPDMRAHSKVPFAERLHWCLKLISKSRSMILTIGMLDTHDGLLIQSKTLASFLHIKPNSLNKNLRDHGFYRQPRWNDPMELGNVGSSLPWEVRRWSKWTHPGISFNRNTPDDVVRQISTQAVTNRRGAYEKTPERVILPSLLGVPFDKWLNK